MSPNFRVCLCKINKLIFYKGIYLKFKNQRFYVVFLMLLSQSNFAQYTNVINSNRPGFSESPYSVGSRVYQLETSFFLRETKKYPIFSRPKSQGIDFLFRTSFFNEKLELNLNFAMQKEQVSFQNIFNSNYFKTGFSKFIIGAKYLIYEQKFTDKSKEIRSWVARNKFDYKRLIPSVAAYAGINTGIPDDIFKSSNFSPKVGILLQNDLNYNFNIITNIFYNHIGAELPELSYIITATYSFNERWSTFIENQTILDKYKYQSSIGTGFAFLYNRNIQLNSSLRLLADSNSSGYYASFGASYRFDRHVDKVLNSDKKNKSLEKKKSFINRAKDFFGNLFKNVTNIFTKKTKRKSTKKLNLNNQTIKSIRKNTTEIKNNDLNVKQLRVKPKRLRVKPSKIKPKKEKTKKGFLSLFKAKSSDEKELKKDIDKNPQELEKEIKKLEKEVKKENKKLEREKRKEEGKKKKEEKKEKKRRENDNESNRN